MDCLKASLPLLKVLCDETRLQILSMLHEESRNACEIHKAFCCTQPTISYHMRLLVETELVHARREGCQMIYSVNQELWPSVQTLLKVLCNIQRHKARRDSHPEGENA